MATSKPAKRRRYSPTEIDAALAVLAYFGGNSFRASEQTGIEAATLRDWRTRKHPDRYERIAQERATELEQLAVTQSREIMLRAGQVEHRILDELDTDGLTTKERAELAGAFQRVTTGKGINVDKTYLMTDRPTERVEHREGTDILRSLGAKVPGLVIDATANDITNPRQLTTDSHTTNARRPV